MISSRRSTIKDIARVAGVSTASVSQALRPREQSNIKLQLETIERIKAVAAQLNYRPHTGARSIRSKKFGVIGYFVARESIVNHTPDGYLAGVQDASEEKGFKIIHTRLSKNVEEIHSTIPTVFNEHNLDALVIESYSDIPRKIHDRIQDSNLPVVYLNDRHDTNAVYVDDFWGAATITEYAVSRGYKDICFLLRHASDQSPNLAEMHHSAGDRVEGYSSAMLKKELKPVVKTVVAEVVGRSIHLSDEQWKSICDHDALICYDDDLLNLICREALAKGLSVPEQLAASGYNGDYGSLCSWMSPTTMKIPSYEMGVRAGEMAIALIELTNGSPMPSTIFKPELLKGETL